MLKITDNQITSDEVATVAQRYITEWDGGPDSYWKVTTWPDRTFDRNQAITAMSLAELEARGITTAKDRALAANWRAELGA